MNESRVAFVGPKEYVDMMRFMGFDCFGVLGKKQAAETISKLEEDNYALIFVSQDVSPDNTGLERVVVLPGVLSKKDDKFLQEEIAKAVGGDIEI